MPHAAGRGKQWLRVTVRASAEASDAVGELLRAAGAAGWETPAPDTCVAYLPRGRQGARAVRALRQRVAALSAFGLDPGPAEVRAEVVDDQPWEEAWKASFRPIRVGRVVVCPTWEGTELAAGDVLLRLDPGMAFGSGAHASTRLCLRALQEELPPGGRVVDLGTGSGILAIAAALLGASRVLALDNDPEVLPIAAGNAARNGVAERVEVRAGDLAMAPADGWQVIVANIAPAPVIEAAPTARALLAPGGAYIGGGIPADRLDAVCDAAAGAGFQVERTGREGEWGAFVARR